MKKSISFVLALLLVLLIPAGAYAAAGDTTVFYSSNSSGYMYEYIDNAMLAGNKVYYLTRNTMHVYDIATKESKEYDVSEMLNMFPDSEPSQDDNKQTYFNVTSYFAYEGELYALCYNQVYYSDREGSEIDGGYVAKIVLEDGVARMELGDTPKLEWANMIESYDTYSYSRWPQSVLCDGSNLYAIVNDDSGNYMLEIFDLTTGKCEERLIPNLYSMTPHKDGRLVLEIYDWADAEKASFVLYDPKTDTQEELATLAIESYTPPTNIAYRADNDTLYYTTAGELWAATGFDFENAVSVNDAPLSSSGSGSAAITDDGFLLLYDYQTIVLRSTDPAQRAEITLRVNDFCYMDPIRSASYDYANKNGDVSVVINRNGSQSDILQAMMNRSDAVDIYCMTLSSSVCNALFNRGYMAELDSSEKLMKMVEDIYPAIKEAVTKDGRLCAVPIGISGQSMGYNAESLKKLGLTADDMPTTWDEFFDFLERLPELLEGNTEVRAFDSWYDQSDLRYSLFNEIFNGYQNYLNASGGNFSFNTPVMQGLIDRLENIDYEALEIVERLYDEETDTWYDNYDGRQALFISYVSTTLSSYYSDGVPLALTFDKDAPMLPVELTIAFVNPFSKHVDEAIEYLEVLSDNLEVLTYYSFYADRNEPIRYPDFEEYKENLRQWREETAKAMETCEEEEKEMYQESLDYYDEELGRIDETYWMVSAQSITNYRKNAQYLSPVTYNCLSYSDGDDTASELWELMQQYYSGLIDSKTLLSSIDKKVQMMRMEGN